MDPDQESELFALEKALYDESVAPTALSPPLLKAITRNFSEDQEIGRGGFGAVYKGGLRNGTVAIKKLFDLIDIDEKKFESEVHFLIGAKHQNTVRFLGYCSDTQRTMEQYNGTTVWAERRQRLLCFEFLPEGKPRTVYYSGYLAPEFLESGEITFKTDIYALGVIFIEVLMGCKVVTKTEEILESWTNVLGTTESHMSLEQVKVCAEIGIQCMDHDPKQRPTIWDIILRLFDEAEISNWSARGVVSSSSIAQKGFLIDKLKLMNLYGRSFLPK